MRTWWLYRWSLQTVLTAKMKTVDRVTINLRECCLNISLSNSCIIEYCWSCPSLMSFWITVSLECNWASVSRRKFSQLDRIATHLSLTSPANIQPSCARYLREFALSLAWRLLFSGWDWKPFCITMILICDGLAFDGWMDRNDSLYARSYLMSRGFVCMTSIHSSRLWSCC